MSEAGIAEAAGVWASGEGGKEWVLVREVGKPAHVQIQVGGFTTAMLTPAQARRLARQLNRLARRIEQREQLK